jgi:hypothetical protein
MPNASVADAASLGGVFRLASPRKGAPKRQPPETAKVEATPPGAVRSEVADYRHTPIELEEFRADFVAGPAIRQIE